MTHRPVHITRTAAFLPNAPVANDTIEGLLGQAGGRPSRARRTVLRSNGIQQRHYAIDPQTGAATHNNAQLAAEAIRRLADAEELAGLPCLACGTSLPDQVMPNHAVMVQGELGLPACEVVATAGICLSGLTALKYAFLGVAAGDHDKAIAAGSDAPSSLLRGGNFEGELSASLDELQVRPELAFEKDFLRWMLSDGAGAVMLEAEPASSRPTLRIDWIDVFSYAGEMEACMYAGAVKGRDGALTGWAQLPPSRREAESVMAIKQDVRLLNENIVNYTVEKPIRAVMEKRRISAADVDYFLPHYSSEYFRDRLRDGLERAGFPVPQTRWFTNLTRCGNTGAASMYIMLDELVSTGALRPGQRLLCWVPESGRFSAGFMHLTVESGRG